MQVYPNDGPDAAAKKLSMEINFGFTVPDKEGTEKNRESKTKDKHVIPTYKYSKLGKGIYMSPSY